MHILGKGVRATDAPAKPLFKFENLNLYIYSWANVQQLFKMHAYHQYFFNFNSFIKFEGQIS